MTKKRPIPSLTDAEEAQIQRQIAADPDDWDATAADAAQAKPFAEAFPDLMASIQKTRGRPKVENPKQHVSMRLDADVLDAFKASGPGWQGRINEALRKAAGLT